MNAPQKAADHSMYSVSVLEHFKNPRHAGELEDADANVEVTNPVCGDTMRLSARIKDGRIAEAKFLARGCVTSIACGSLVAEKLQNASPAEIAKITPEQISESLGGLPPATFHGAQLASDAISSLLEKLK
jgi:nitrogen fixation protein NifU and related proteins